MQERSDEAEMLEWVVAAVAFALGGAIAWDGWFGALRATLERFVP